MIISYQERNTLVFISAYEDYDKSSDTIRDNTIYLHTNLISILDIDYNLSDIRLSDFYEKMYVEFYMNKPTLAPFHF